jgi:hypothetical protein
LPEKTDQPASTDLAEREPSAANPLALIDDTFTKDEVGAIAKFIGVSAEDPGFRPFLAVAASMGLSPLNSEIWLIKGRREVGGKWEDFYRPAAGRDGFLRKAEESPKFRGIRSNTVCANDTFEVEDDGEEVKMVHRFKSLSPNAPKGKEARYRGPVIGAWAKVFFRDGRPPLFYFAPAHEHVKTKVKDGNVEFAGAWSYTSAMCEKAAQSRVLRLAFRITGIVPVDELRSDDPQMVASSTTATDADGESIADDPGPKNAEFIDGLEQVPEELRKELTIALEQLNELIPFSWTPAKVRMRLGSGCDEEKARAVLEEVEAEFKALRDKQAEREAREVESVEEAVQVVLARDIKPPVELLYEVDVGEHDWVLIEDAVFDQEAARMVLKTEMGEKTFSPTDELEVRSPQDASPDEG